MKITLRQIAEDLNISTATASLALNDAPRISKETKERVHAYAKKVGYRYNRLARNLRMRRTRVIGCVLPSVISPVAALKLKYLYIEAFRRNYQLQVLFSETDINQEIRALEECIDSCVDGLILQPASPAIELCGKSHPLNRRELKSFPVVLFSPVVGKFPSVSNGIKTALQTCLRHVREKGYQSVALFTQESLLNDETKIREIFSTLTEENKFLKNRRLLFSVHTKLEQLGVENSAGSRVQQYFDFDRIDEWAYDAVPKLLKHPFSYPLAVICRNDQIAAGVFRYCREHKLQVPEDIGILGIDDTIAHYLGVTSIRWDYSESARLVFDHLEARIEGKRLSISSQVGHELIERASTQR